MLVKLLSKRWIISPIISLICLSAFGCICLVNCRLVNNSPAVFLITLAPFNLINEFCVKAHKLSFFCYAFGLVIASPYFVFIGMR